MRISALPNFRKLHRKLKLEGVYKDGLPVGEYQLTVDYSEFDP